MQSRSSAVAALASLPLFQLSTAGMELFHTNMLYWLATERPGESIAVWNALGLSNLRLDQQPLTVRREWHHIDLAVWSGDDRPALVLENKIGAIPSSGQLDGYYNTPQLRRPPSSQDSTEFVLLTLTRPSFAFPAPWRSVTYKDLVPALRETSQRLTGSDAGLVAAYAELVTWLDAVAAVYDPAVDLDAPYALLPDERSLLNESRLLSLVEKVRAGRFAEIATKLLTTELGVVDQVSADFSRGLGMNHWFIDGPAGRRIGWQIQGYQFRLAVIGGERDPGVKAGLEELVTELYEPYFDFTLPDHLLSALGRSRSKKQWLGYKPSFVYRYAKLTPQTTWRELLGLATWFSRRALEFAAGR